MKMLLLILLIISSFTFFMCKIPESNPQIPYEPNNFSTIGTISGINLNWTDTNDSEDSFTIKRGLVNDPDDSSTILISDSVPENTESYSDLSAVENTNYYYFICAVNLYGTSAWVSAGPVQYNTSYTFTTLIIDHEAVDAFDDIPQGYIDEVKKMIFIIGGESHGRAYIYATSGIVE